jgi:hypothetical protein
MIESGALELLLPRVEIDLNDVGARKRIAHQRVAERRSQRLAGLAPFGRYLQERHLGELPRRCDFAL